MNCACSAVAVKLLHIGRTLLSLLMSIVSVENLPCMFVPLGLKNQYSGNSPKLAGQLSVSVVAVISQGNCHRSI